MSSLSSAGSVQGTTRESPAIQTGSADENGRSSTWIEASGMSPSSTVDVNSRAAWVSSAEPALSGP